MTLNDLPTAWRTRAGDLRRYAAEAQAKTLEEAATELEAAMHAQLRDELTRAQAVEEFDIHPDTLTRLVREGKLINRGRNHAPRYCRGDLVALGLKPRTSPYQVDPAPVGEAAGDDSSLDSFTRRLHGRGRR